MNTWKMFCLSIFFLPWTGNSVAQHRWQFTDKPVWQDEFDVEGLPDKTKWKYDVGGHGWGNNELQYYTEADSMNAFVSDGILHISAQQQDDDQNPFTSARLVSIGKGDFLYGRVEFRARVPKGRGTWPAVWMLPTDQVYGGWPASGEIDLLEHVGYDPDVVHISVHTEKYHHSIGTQKTAKRKLRSASDEFQQYRLDWTPDYIIGFINDEQLFEFRKDSADYKAWPFDKNFHILINLAVGGEWGGQQGIDEDAFPAVFEVDYIRVYPLIE